MINGLKHIFSFISLMIFFLIPGKNKSQSLNDHVRFTENKGQVSDQFYKPRADVLFVCAAGNIYYYLKSSGISYQLIRIDNRKKSNKSDLFLYENLMPVTEQKTIYRLDIDWLNANKNCFIERCGALEDYTNYYLEVCPTGATHVKSYTGVIYKNIYNNINLHYYSKDGNLKYDYIVAPGGNYKKIQLQINGAKNIKINKNNELVIETPLGDVIEQAPEVFQNKKKLKAKWVVENSTVSFEILDIDPKQYLIIDPMIRLWATLYGGIDSEASYATCTDKNENVYFTGYTESSASIATIGSFQYSYSGTEDVFLAKFNKSGIRKWSTYYGGSSREGGTSCSTDKDNNVYIAGNTDSPNVIATAGAHQNLLSGGSDAFLTKFDSAGILLWGTYYGDTETEISYNCSTDLSGNVILTGGTLPTGSVSNAIATPGAHQTIASNNLTVNDGFIVKFNGQGTRLWGTYYGGASYDICRGSCSDKNGNIYVTGITSSSVSISSPGSYQPQIGTSNNAFLVKFDSLGARQWGTYYGEGGTTGLCCAMDTSSNIYMVGQTESINAIASEGSYQTSYGGTYGDAYIAKFNSTGIRLWGTYYGGNEQEFAWSCATDKQNNVYIAGASYGDTLGVAGSPNGYQPAHSTSAISNAILAKFDSNGFRKWGTFYGENGEAGYGCATDNSGYIYMSGYSIGSTGSVIASPGAHQTIPGSLSQWDALLVKFFGCEPVVTFTNHIYTGCFGLSNASVTIEPFGGVSYTYTWMPGGNNTNAIGNLGNGTYTCYVHNACSQDTVQIINVTQPSSLIAVSASSDSSICSGETFTLTTNISGGVLPYNIIYNNTSIGPSFISLPLTTTIYNITIKDGNNCVSTTTLTEIVNACVGIKEINNLNERIRIYPNPNNGEFYIDQIENYAGKEIEIFNSLGLQIQRLKIETPLLKVNISDFAKGMYFLKILDRNCVLSILKIIKN